MNGDLDGAAAQFDRANAWQARWPAVTNLRAAVYSTAEEFETAAELYRQTLALVPDHVEAMLGRIRSLTYLGRYLDALSAVDDLLRLERWYIGDAYYFRALNQLRLERFDEAWESVQRAAALITNAEVPKLAGIIAVQRQQLDEARARFEESRARSRVDCETAFYLGVVLSEQRAWAGAADALVEAIACLDRSIEALDQEVARLRASSIGADRRARQIARREQRIAAEGRTRAAAAFNAAVAAFNLSRFEDARQLAQQVADDAQFGERARSLLTRLPGQP
jgi:tetratricopeptide (TPR) repeat protein